MKRLFLIPILALALFVSGCASTNNSNVGPGLLRLGVSSAASYSIQRYPEAVPGVTAGKDIICSVAMGTDLSPVNIVAALYAYDQKTPESVFILNAAIGAYTLVYNGLSDTNAAKPYVTAVCDGLNDALVGSRDGRVLGSTQWPQLHFP